MQFLLYTSILVFAIRGREPAGLAGRLKSLSPGATAISAVTRFELMFGASRSRDPAAWKQAEEAIESTVSLPLTDAVADEAARIRAHLAQNGTPIGPYDLLIAATAVHHKLTLVTANGREFSRVPQRPVEDWSAA